MNDGIYEKVWFLLNQNDLREIDKELNVEQLKFVFDEVKIFFDNNTNCKFINSNNKHYLQEKGILFNYLEKNFEAKINKNRIQANNDIREFQIQIIKDKCMYAVCPYSGEIIKSNQSVVVTRDVIFYRFSSKEVFYIITTHMGEGFKKGAIYFPKHELVVKNDHKIWGLREEFIIQFKALLVTRFREFYDYFSYDYDSKKVAIIVGNPNYAHHLWNELSGLHRLYRKRTLHEIDKFFVLREPLGPIHQIFPEISAHKIKYFNGSGHSLEPVASDLLQEVTSNKYLVVNVGDRFIKNDLADSVYKVAVKNSSFDVVNTVRKARKQHFPLLWVSIRVDNRTWDNQVSGLTEIINLLAKDFPRLGVVFDGFSLPADYLTNRHLGPNDIELETMKCQNDIVSKINNGLSNLEIGVFNTVGCSIWETNIWAHTIDIYLAHHGTIQHKVGWLANKPGIVHSNKKTLEKRNQWVANVREFGITPIYIDHIHAKDVNLEDEEAKYDLHHNLDLRDNLDNYNIDWKILYDELWKLAKLIAERRTFMGKLLYYLEENFKNIKKVLKPKLRWVLNIARTLYK